MARSPAASLIWVLIAVTVGLICLTYEATDTSLVGTRNMAWVPVSLLLLVGASWFYSRIRPDMWISSASEAAAQTILIAGLSTLLGFGIAAAGARFPYRDPFLAAMDRAMGLDWRGYVAMVDARPQIQPVLKFCYLSIDWTYPLVLIALTVAGDRSRLDRYLLALWTSLMLTMALFLVMPATAAYVHYGVGLAGLHNLRPTFLLNRFNPLLDAMREAGPHIVRLDDLEGLVTFPSFHAAAAMLFTWGVWSNRWLRWPMLAVNLIMLAATPVEGAHYFVDILGGFVVAGFALWAGGWLERWARRAHRPGPSGSQDASGRSSRR